MKIRKDKLWELLGKLKEQGYQLIAPKEEDNIVIFAPIEDVQEIASDYVNTTLSPKELLFPRTEALFQFQVNKEGVELHEPEEIAPRRVIFGMRPCDAASLPILDHIFGWDYDDKYWQKRRQATLVIAVSCVKADEACFCTALGLDPGSPRGADLLLTPINEQEYLVEVPSEKGKKLVEEYGSLFEEGEADKNALLKEVREYLPPPLELEKLREWLKENFFSEFWEEQTLRCLGCGTCTYVCPTCHCFDIVDEGDMFRGQRQRNWDSCQLGLFTLHASGHNPRRRQDERHRQRIQHKFVYYFDRFGETLCVGCGRCQRRCPIDLHPYHLFKAIPDGSVTGKK